MSGPWIKLDASFWHNLKVIGAGNDATGVYVRALAYCGGSLTDGFIPRAIAKQLGTPGELNKVTRVGLWQEVVEGEWLSDGLAAPTDGYYIADYLEHQRSRAEVHELRAERSRAGRKGAEKRWQQP